MRIYLHPKFKGLKVDQIRTKLINIKPNKKLTKWDKDLAKDIYKTLDLNKLPRTVFKDFVDRLYAKNKKAWRNFYYLSRGKKTFGRLDAVHAAIKDTRCEHCNAMWVVDYDNGFCEVCCQDPAIQKLKDTRILNKIKRTDTSIYGTKRKYPELEEITWSFKKWLPKHAHKIEELANTYVDLEKTNAMECVNFLEALYKDIDLWKRFTYFGRALSKRSLRYQIIAAINSHICDFCSSNFVQVNVKHMPCLSCRADPKLDKVYEKLRAKKVLDSYKERTGYDHHMQNPKVANKLSKTLKKKSKEEWAIRRKKAAKTNLKKYGVSHPNQRPEAKENIKAFWSNMPREEIDKINNKRRKTTRKAYGVDYYTQHPDFIKKAEEGHLRNRGYTHNMRDPKHKEARVKAHLEKYGVKNPMQRKEILDKVHRTTKERYGGIGLASKVIKAKAYETNLERYGYEVPTANPKIMDKCKATWTKIYGYYNPNMCPIQASKGLKNSFSRKTITLEGKQFTVQGNNETLFLKRLVSKFGVKNVHTQFSKRYRELGISTRLGWSPDFLVRYKGKNLIYELKSTYTLFGTEEMLLKNMNKAANSNVRFVFSHNKRFYLLPKDWYEHPNIKYLCYELAHKHIGPQRISYILRTIQAMLSKHNIAPIIKGSKISANNKSINVFDLFDIQNNRAVEGPFITTEDWKNHRQAARKYIYRYFNLPEQSIYARKCKLINIDFDKAKAFFDENHIQGAPRKSICLALKYNNVIVAVMAFSNVISIRGKKKVKGEYELIRYATSCKVVGGASRLLKEFERQYKPNLILSYADNRMFSGAMYEQHLGFEKVGKVKPGYRTIWDFFTLDVRNPQFTTRSKLEQFPWFNPNLSEKANCEANFIQRVYDSGKTKFIKTYI